eukprot:CAMPEP_0172929886 /NCGR_PEP_ID=MMETSP1075-20121228/218710_1 /TAXON_ID=2916 /ORGANISM="Ceratium fusus, Strain PA161109" /LENGTH=209 /DNA_ID=CAMNT_0013791191 /DNA_START=69 /DNA_END=698 /DNA_ORIENTATION=-
MAIRNRMLPAGACNVAHRQQPRVLAAVIMAALAVAVLMGAGSAFTVAVAAAAPRLQRLAPGLSSQFAGAVAKSVAARPQTAMAALSWMPSMPQTSAFTVAVAAAAPRLQRLAPGLSSQLAGAAANSVTARPQSAMAALSWMPSMPQTCNDDFDCNEGRANFPLQCLDMVFLKVCIDPDDFERSTAGSGELAYVPIPVQVEDNPYGRQGR